MKKKLLIIVCTILVLTACSEDSLYNFLLGPQPNFIDKEMLSPGMNIFGILRPDSMGSKPISFVHVEKIVAAINESDTFSFEVNDAVVKVYKFNNGSIIDSIPFVYIANDSMYSMYRPENFTPKSGDHYKIICNAEDLPELSGETTIPEVPALENDTIISEGNKIHFTILEDTSAAMYDVYLFTGSDTYTKRIMRAKLDNTVIEIAFSGNLSSDARLTIYAYDKNLAEYFSATNVFIKPNTYRPPFSNVRNGYGCFGSMNILNKKI